MTQPEVKPGSPIIEMDASVLDPDSNNHTVSPSQCTNTEPASPNTDRIPPGQASHKRTKSEVTGMTWSEVLLLLRRCTLDGDACCPHEGGCPPQLLQVAIELVPQ